MHAQGCAKILSSLLFIEQLTIWFTLGRFKSQKITKLPTRLQTSPAHIQGHGLKTPTEPQHLQKAEMEFKLDMLLSTVVP